MKSLQTLRGLEVLVSLYCYLNDEVKSYKDRQHIDKYERLPNNSPQNAAEKYIDSVSLTP